MHMPLCWLLLHSYCWQELVKSMWSKCSRPYTCGVCIFIRNTHVCSFVISFVHFFHSRKSWHIWHAGTSAQYHLQWGPRGFPAWSWWIHRTGERNVRGKAWFSFIPLLTWEILPRPLFPKGTSPCCWSSCAKLALQLPLHQSPERAPQGLWQQAGAATGDGDNYSLAVREMSEERTLCSSSLPCGCPVAVTALEA